MKTAQPTDTIAMIPARIGSERLKQKNLRLLGEKPVLAHAIAAAKISGAFSRIVVNGDDPVFARIAAAEDVEFYLRPAELGSSQARSDDVVADFIAKHPSRIITWVNPTSPLQSPKEISDIIQYFEREKFDSLITTRREGFHAMYENRPLNFDPNGKFARTQDLSPVSIFVYSVMMWRTAPFMEQYRAEGHAITFGRFGTYDVSRLSCLVLKTEDDFAQIEAAYLRASAEVSTPRYFE